MGAQAQANMCPEASTSSSKRLRTRQGKVTWSYDGVATVSKSAPVGRAATPGKLKAKLANQMREHRWAANMVEASHLPPSTFWMVDCVTFQTLSGGGIPSMVKTIPLAAYFSMMGIVSFM